MILTEPAIAIIEDSFGHSLHGVAKVRLLGRMRRGAAPFTSQAYAERALVPALDRPRASAAATPGAAGRRTVTHR